MIDENSCLDGLNALLPLDDVCINEARIPLPIIQGVATFKQDKKGQKLIFNTGNVVYLQKPLEGIVLKNGQKVKVEYNDEYLKIYYI